MLVVPTSVEVHSVRFKAGCSVSRGRASGAYSVVLILKLHS